ncbi:hypothetical protein HY988_06490 [Candidatus Micrarchaeota archaeon]|nr:hypothetical protein [Candidatus Micrarchaeota archaeon]
MGIKVNQAGILMAAGGGAVAASSLVSDARGTPFELAGAFAPAPARAVFGGLTAAVGIGLFATTFLAFSFLSSRLGKKPRKKK